MGVNVNLTLLSNKQWFVFNTELQYYHRFQTGALNPQHPKHFASLLALLPLVCFWDQNWGKLVFVKNQWRRLDQMKYTGCNFFPIDHWDMIIYCFIDVLHAPQLGIRLYYGTQSLAKCHGFWFQENNTKWKGWQIEWFTLVAVCSHESPSSYCHHPQPI